MLGFGSIAAAALADDVGVQVSTHSLTFNEITTTPVVDTAPVFKGEQFIFNDIVTGAPVIDAIETPVASNIVADDVVSGAPSVDNINIDFINVLNANDVTATPVVDTATTAFTDVLNAISLGPEVTNYTVTVADNYGNKFYIDGVSNPTLSLVRGQKYVFDVSDATNDGHPLRFKDGSGNSYTTGVTTSGTAGQSGATVTILVSADAPSTLRYYCTVHGNGMGNTISVSSQALDLQPQIDTVSVSVFSNFVANEITTTPVVDQTTVLMRFDFTANNITLGAPVVDNASVFERETCNVNGLTVTPVVDSISVSDILNFPANEITTGAPQVDALPFFQEYELTVVDIVTGAPTLPARFVWDFQELAPGDWSDLALAAGVWTDQLKNPENWSRIN